jgi:hypothetical protein
MQVNERNETLEVQGNSAAKGAAGSRRQQEEPAEAGESPRRGGTGGIVRRPGLEPRTRGLRVRSGRSLADLDWLRRRPDHLCLESGRSKWSTCDQNRGKGNRHRTAQRPCTSHVSVAFWMRFHRHDERTHWQMPDAWRRFWCCSRQSGPWVSGGTGRALPAVVGSDQVGQRRAELG